MIGAEVTFDVALPKIVWGWLVSTNMWAKSIATGTFLLGFYFIKRYPQQDNFFRKWLPILGIIFIGNLGSMGGFRFCNSAFNILLGVGYWK